MGRLSPQESKALDATWHKGNNRRKEGIAGTAPGEKGKIVRVR